MESNVIDAIKEVTNPKIAMSLMLEIMYLRRINND
jgi:hypothetical protein